MKTDGKRNENENKKQKRRRSDVFYLPFELPGPLGLGSSNRSKMLRTLKEQMTPSRLTPVPLPPQAKQKFERPKNSEDNKVFDDFWTKSIVSIQFMFSKELK